MSLRARELILMIGRQDDNVHDNNDENKDDADDDAGNEMIMMLRIG